MTGIYSNIGNFDACQAIQNFTGFSPCNGFNSATTFATSQFKKLGSAIEQLDLCNSLTAKTTIDICGKATDSMTSLAAGADSLKEGLMAQGKTALEHLKELKLPQVDAYTAAGIAVGLTALAVGAYAVSVIRNMQKKIDYLESTSRNLVSSNNVRVLAFSLAMTEMQKQITSLTEDVALSGFAMSANTQEIVARINALADKAVELEENQADQSDLNRAEFVSMREKIAELSSQMEKLNNAQTVEA